MSFFDHVSILPPDPVLSLTQAFRADLRPNKINLGVGLYKTATLETPVLESVKQAEREILKTEASKEYFPIDGDPQFVEKIGELIFGKSLWQSEGRRIYGAQTAGGTAALRIAGDFFKQEMPGPFYISDPTWPNHKGIFTRVGFQIESYPYYDREKEDLDFDRLYDCLSRAEKGSIVLLHACCHNPSGADLSFKEWKVLSDLFLSKKLFPFFDFAYQGFAEGLDEDAAAIRLFVEAGHEMAVAYSLSKNFAIYSEREGALFIVAGSDSRKAPIGSKIKALIRTLYSNPPRHGASIATYILQHPSIKMVWEKEVALMRERIHQIRHQFSSVLLKKSAAHNFSYIEKQKGLFSFLPVDKGQVERLKEEYGIYLMADGRINILGLNKSNLGYMVDALIHVLK